MLAIIFESVGAGEWIVLLAVLLVVMGPKRLPSTVRKFGNYYAKFRRAADSFKRQLLEMDTEIQRQVDQVEREVTQVEHDVAASVQAAENEVADVTRDFEAPLETPDAPMLEVPETKVSDGNQAS